MQRSVRRPARIVAGAGLAVGVAAVAGYVGLVTAAVPIDLGIGRRLRPLGPRTIVIDAPREVVYGVIAQPYLGRATRAMREKIRVSSICAVTPRWRSSWTQAPSSASS